MRAFLLALLFVAVVSAARLVEHDSPRAINGSYIVVLKESLTIHDRDAHIQELKDRIHAAKATEADVSFVYNIGSFIGFAARLTPDLLKTELQHPDVEYVAADQEVSLNYKVDKPISSHPRPLAVTQTGATWGLARIDQTALPVGTTYAYNSSAGAGVTVYVIDTGILITHVDFGTRAAWGFSAVTSEANTDLNGHGTHCSGTIAGTTYGVAKNANLVAVKVLSGAGSGTVAGVIAGVNFVAGTPNTSPRVASMSLGGGASPTLDAAVAAAIVAGIPFSIAAGNDNGNACNGSPARVPTAVTVGATTNTDARASYSNYGTCVDIFAPGSSITSDWIGAGNGATNTISGTSMATPHVAGVLALHLADSPNTNPADLATWLTSVATPGVVTGPGTGSPNLLLYAPYV